MQQVDSGIHNDRPGQSVTSFWQRLQIILQLALPITAGMLSQSLINLVDTALIGRLGEEALAAVAAANYAVFVCFAMISGLSVAVQSRVARYCGAEQWAKVMNPVSKGVRSAFLVGIPVTLLLFWATPFIIKMFYTQPEITALAEDYFRLRILSLPAGMMLLTYRGFWNGCQHPFIYLRTLVTVHVLNALLSYVLIFGLGPVPPFGLTGAAAGTVIAMYTGVLVNTLRVKLFATERQIPLRSPSDVRATPLYQQAWPDSAQQTLFAVGTALLFWLIARIGSEAMAVSHVLVTVSLLLILPGIGLGMAATTLINQSLGAGNPKEAYRWGMEIVAVAAVVFTLMSLLLLITPELVLALFIPVTSPLIDYGQLSLQLVGVGVICESGALVLTQALLGTGCNKTVLHIRIFTLWLVALPITGIGIVWLGFGLTEVWVIQILQRLLMSLLFLRVWRSRRWAGD